MRRREEAPLNGGLRAEPYEISMSEGLGRLCGRARSGAQDSKASCTRIAGLGRRCKIYLGHGVCDQCGKIGQVCATKLRQKRKWDESGYEEFQESIRKKRKWDEICNEALVRVNVSIGETEEH